MGRLRELVAQRSAAEREVLDQAFAFALAAHGEVARKSGEPFITHPVAVATILAMQGVDTPTLAAALLHDTVEDVDTVTFEEVERLFGPEVCLMVRGVTRLSKLQAAHQDRAFEPDWVAEDLRQFMMYARTEPRILLIKLADRLHNMRTLGSLPPRKQWKNAQETLLFFAPLAAHLGMSDVRTELMNLSWQYLAPQEFTALREELEQLRPRGEALASLIGTQLRGALAADPLLAGLGLEVEVSSRVKSGWRVYQKQQQGMTLSEIVDLLSLRVIIKTSQPSPIADASLCYVVLGHLHGLWQSRTQHFKDYVGSPKRNGYQSLHTVIIGEDIGQLEVQIRSQAMHEVAQRGILTSWQGGVLTRPLGGPQLTARLTQALGEILDANASDALSDMQEQLGAKVMTYTPQGKRIWLPKGSTALDFAYSIHSNLGRHAAQARVNGRLSPLDTPLRSGMVVEIIKSEEAQPQPEWMNIAVSQQAREQLRLQLRELRGWRNLPEQAGYQLLRQELLARGHRSQRLLQHKVLEAVAYKLLGLRNTDELVIALEEGRLVAGAVADAVLELGE